MKRVFVHRLFDTYDMTTGMDDFPPGRSCMSNYLPYGRSFRPYGFMSSRSFGFMSCDNLPMRKKDREKELQLENSIKNEALKMAKNARKDDL